MNFSLAKHALALALILASFGAQAQAPDSFPTKPVRLLVAFPPGQTTDVVARMIADELTKVWGRQVVVDNRAGGNSIPGTVAGRNAPADGYTILLATASSFAINPSLYTNLPYDPAKDFAMICNVFSVPILILAHPSAPYKGLKDMVDAARSSPDKLGWGYSSTTMQLGGELFKLRTGVKILGIPYKGSGQSTTDLLGGQITLLLDTPAATLSQIKAGKMKALAIMSPRRVPQLPDVPTVAELGYPGFEASGWGGFVVPKATPSHIVQRIGEDVARILKDPTVEQKIIERAIVPDFLGPKEWTQFVNAEITKWADVVRKANVKVD